MIRTWLPRAGMFILLAGVLLSVAGCGQLDFAMGPLLSNVTVSKSMISPNADGVDDATEIAYTLRRPADVSIYFENAAGERFYFATTAAARQASTACSGAVLSISRRESIWVTGRSRF
jgi:hypothetical protein